MKILAHCDYDQLVVRATSGKLYSIQADHKPFDPRITGIEIILLRDGETTKEAEERALMMFEKAMEGRVAPGQGKIDITEWYKLMTPEQMALLYD